jgi:hypothetical protein
LQRWLSSAQFRNFWEVLFKVLSPRDCASEVVMKKYLHVLLAVIPALCAVALAPIPCVGDEIPKTAWRRPLGQPLANPGVRKNKSDIDDGYWQGAPVGGFGAGTFSRTYRGDFARWHIFPAS